MKCLSLLPIAHAQAYFEEAATPSIGSAAEHVPCPVLYCTFPPPLPLRRRYDSATFSPSRLTDRNGSTKNTRQ